MQRPKTQWIQVKTDRQKAKRDQKQVYVKIGMFTPTVQIQWETSLTHGPSLIDIVDTSCDFPFFTHIFEQTKGIVKPESLQLQRKTLSDQVAHVASLHKKETV